MKIYFKKLNKGAIPPSYASNFSAGADLRVCLERNLTILPGAIELIPTGIAAEIPSGYFGMICSRSGLAAKNGIIVLNSPGIIDSDYRGEIKLIMINHSLKPFTIEPGMRLAQLIVVPFQKGNWIEAEALSESDRGIGGIGSTGLK